MNIPDRLTGRPSRPRAAGFFCLQFAVWWCAFYVTMLLLVWAEEARLRHDGVRYLAPGWLEYVNVGEFQLTNDGRWGVAVMSFRGSRAKAGVVPDLVLFDLDRRTVSRLGLCRFVPRRVALEPCGDSIAIASGYVIYVATRPELRADGDAWRNTQVRVLHRTQDEEIGRLVFSADGRRLAAVGNRYTHLLSLPDGELVRRLGEQDRLARAIFSDDWRHLILFGFNQQVSWYDAQNGRLIASRSLPEQGVVSTVLSAGGTLAAQVWANGDLSLWDAESGVERWRRHAAVAPRYGHECHERIACSPDGRLLGVVCAVGKSYQVYFHDMGTGVPVGRTPVFEAAFKGLILDGDHIAYCWDLEGVLHAWDAARGVELWRFAWPQAATGTRWPLEEPIPCRGGDAAAARWFRLHLFASPF